MVGRRSVWVEVCSRGCIDRIEMRILAVVGSEQLENSCHRKGKGSLTLQFSQGLVGPNCVCKSNYGKGKKVNIPLLFLYVWQHKPVF